MQALIQEEKWQLETSGRTEVVFPRLQKPLIMHSPCFFQIFVNGFFLLPCIQWPGPIPCLELEQTMVYFIEVITYGSWLESTVQWCRQMKRDILGGGSYVNIKSNLKLSKTNYGLKSGVIFPSEILGKLSLAFQIPNLKRGHGLWSWRLATDVDLYTRFSGFSKWQIYSIRTFHVLLRTESFSDLWVTLGDAPTHEERRPRPALPQRWAGPGEGRAALPARSGGSSAAAPGLLLPPPASWHKGPRQQPQSFSPSLPALGRRQERGSGAGRRLGGMPLWERAAACGGGHGDGSYCRCLFFLPPPGRTWLWSLLSWCWNLWQMPQYLEWKNAIWTIGGVHEVWKEGRWAEGKQMTASPRLASKLMPHGSQMTEHSCMAAWSHYSHPHQEICWLSQKNESGKGKAEGLLGPTVLWRGRISGAVLHAG